MIPIADSDKNKYELTHIVGSNIRRHRTAGGFSQEKLSEMIQVSKNYISALETGVKFPSAETIAQLCKVLQIEYYELFLDTGKLMASQEIEKHVAQITAYFKEHLTEIFQDLMKQNT